MPRLHRIFSEHKPDRSYKKHNTNSIFKVGDKALKSNAKNSHRMAWPLHHSKRPGKGRYWREKH